MTGAPRDHELPADMGTVDKPEGPSKRRGRDDPPAQSARRARDRAWLRASGNGADLQAAGQRRHSDDGKRGIFTGDAIIRADARAPTSPREHPGVVIGNKSSVIVSHSVMVGSPGGKGLVPMENPSAQTRCPVLDGLAYCY